MPARVPTLASIDPFLLSPARIPSAADRGASVLSAVIRSRLLTSALSAEDDEVTRDPTFTQGFIGTHTARVHAGGAYEVSICTCGGWLFRGVSVIANSGGPWGEKA